AVNESVKVAKGLFGPDVQAAFRRIARGEFYDGQGAGKEEEQRRKSPQAERGRSIVGSGCDPTRTKDGCNVEQQHIPESHFAAKLRPRVSPCGRLADSGGASAATELDNVSNAAENARVVNRTRNQNGQRVPFFRRRATSAAVASPVACLGRYCWQQAVAADRRWC